MTRNQRKKEIDTTKMMMPVHARKYLKKKKD